MSHVYHRVPEHMVGDVLYPMNQLKEVDERLYQLYKSGYEGRERLLERTIPFLHCLWNDVLHCSPVHPQKIKEAMIEIGLADHVPTFDFFEIDTNTDVDMSKAVIFYRHGDRPDDISFQKASEVDIDKLNAVPELTRNYYESLVANNESPFVYQFIPHFLYKGLIDTRNLKRIILS